MSLTALPLEKTCLHLMTMSENKILKVEEFSPKLISLEKGRGQEFTKKPEKQEDL